MKLVDNGSLGEVCLICNSLPNKDEFSINTEVPFVDPAQKHLVKFKHICQKCADEIVALVPDKSKELLKKRAAKAEIRLANTLMALDSFTQSVMHVSD